MNLKDRRWRTILSFLAWAPKHVQTSESSESEALARLNECVDALAALAADANLPAKDRLYAQELAEQLSVHKRAAIPEALKTLAAQVHSDDALSPEDRAEARRLLDSVTDRLPPASGSRH